VKDFSNKFSRPIGANTISFPDYEPRNRFAQKKKILRPIGANIISFPDYESLGWPRLPGGLCYKTLV
jgi:hypothetical protein